MTDVVLTLCDDRFFLFFGTKNEAKFISLGDAQRWATNKGLQVVRVEECKRQISRNCCTKNF